MVFLQSPGLKHYKNQGSDSLWTSVDFRRCNCTALCIHGEEVERVEYVKFLGVHISAEVTWTICIFHQVKKHNRGSTFPRHAHLPPHLLSNLYWSASLSLLTYSTLVNFTSCTEDGPVRVAEHVIIMTPPHQRHLHWPTPE